MIEERPRRLMTTLEDRVEALVEARRESRVQQQALHNRLAELEQGRQALEARNAELQARAEQALANRDELAGRLQALEARLAESEDARRELVEENRELDEQNRELESHTQRLQARLDGQDDAEAPRSNRPSRGLSALMGHQRAEASGEASSDEAAAGDAPSSGEASSGEPSSSEEQSRLPIGEAPSPQALLAQWYRRYGDAFFKGHTRPLKVGIHEELGALEPWPEKLVRRALACYVNLPRYLKSVREGAERIDLNGEPAGVVDQGAADHARRKLERLRAERQQKGKTARADKPARSDRPQPARPASPAPEPSSRASAPAEPSVAPEPAPADEPAGDRLQRKLDELMSRHNGR